MLIERRQLAEIIAQEVRLRLRELAEAGEDSEGGDGAKRKRPRKPTTADAEDSPSPKGKMPTGPRADPDADPEQAAPDGPPSDEDDGDDGGEDISDDEGIDQGGNAGEESSGAVNNDLAGKTIQAITIEPQSQILPGAKEVVLSFRETSDSLRIIVTATGLVKFFLGGQLHDIP